MPFVTFVLPLHMLLEQHSTCISMSRLAFSHELTPDSGQNPIEKDANSAMQCSCETAILKV
jgi:hypothetical protein